MGIGILIAAASTVALTAPGPDGPLAGTLLDAGSQAPIVVIIPGSGPTDRDGNNPLGVTAAPYRLLAEALATKGISTVRIDKRGMFGSKAATADANAVTLEDYASDVHSWSAVIGKRTGAKCVWLLGHSEGGLIALTAAPDVNVCGLILVSAPGRPMGAILREQLNANPANSPILKDAERAIAAFESGERVDVSGLHPALQALFAPQVQGFLINLMAQDPARLAARVDKPLLILSGGRDLQVTEADAKALSSAQPRATARVIPSMNHVLKNVAADDRAANLSTYADPSLPVSDALVNAIATFVHPSR